MLSRGVVGGWSLGVQGFEDFRVSDVGFGGSLAGA